jgi:hypothetical protein
MTAPAPLGLNVNNNHIAKRAPSRHDGASTGPNLQKEVQGLIGELRIVAPPAADAGQFSGGCAYLQQSGNRLRMRNSRRPHRFPARRLRVRRSSITQIITAMLPSLVASRSTSLSGQSGPDPQSLKYRMSTEDNVQRARPARVLSYPLMSRGLSG